MPCLFLTFLVTLYTVQDRDERVTEKVEADVYWASPFGGRRKKGWKKKIYYSAPSWINPV